MDLKIIKSLLLFLTMIFEANIKSFCQADWVLDTAISIGPVNDFKTKSIEITHDNKFIIIGTENDYLWGGVQNNYLNIISTKDYKLDTVNVFKYTQYLLSFLISKDDSFLYFGGAYDLNGNTVYGLYKLNLNSKKISIFFTNTFHKFGIWGFASNTSGTKLLLTENGYYDSAGIQYVDTSGKTSNSFFYPYVIKDGLGGIGVSTGDSNAIIGRAFFNPINFNMRTKTFTKIDSIHESWGLAMYHNKNQALISDGYFHLYILNLNNDSIIKTINTNLYRPAIVISDDDRYAILSSLSGIKIVDLKKDSIIKIINKTSSISAINYDGSKFYVIDTSKDSVWIYKKVNPTGIMKISKTDNNINIYPNPSTGNITIESADVQINSVEIFNENGELLIHQNFKEVTFQAIMNLETLKAGSYLLKLFTNKGQVVKNFVKLR